MLIYWISRLVAVAAQIIIWALLATAILSWFANPYRMGYNHPLVKIYAVLTRLTAPIVMPARKLLARVNTGPIDLSIFLTMLFIYIIERGVLTLLRILA